MLGVLSFNKPEKKKNHEVLPGSFLFVNLLQVNVDLGITGSGPGPVL